MERKDIRKVIGQLMVCGFNGITADENIKRLIRDYKIGGVILFSRNIGGTDDVLRLTAELQQTAREAGHDRPLLICIDQENGVVRRLGTGATVFPGAMLLGAAGDPQNAYREGLATGIELKALGINWNLAPVADVNNNSKNPVIGVRSYGEDPYKVSAFAGAAIRGMQEAGVITTLKHFPGHGDTSVDSHLDLPVVPYEMDRLERVELVPYKELAGGTADTIMTAHIKFPSIDDSGLPATLSETIISGLLRQKLGFNGVVTTDCLEMNAVKSTFGTARGAVMAIRAGVDIVMVSHTFELQTAAADELFESAEKGEIPEGQLLQAYERVCRLKDRYLAWDTGGADRLAVVGCKQHSDLAWDIYRRGVTLYRNEGILPVSDVIVIYPAGGSVTQAEDITHSGCSLGRAVREIRPQTEVLEVSQSPGDEDIANAVEAAAKHDAVIVGTLSAVQDEKQAELVRRLIDCHKKVAVVAMKSPYDISRFPDIKAYIATYEQTYPALLAAARVIFGLDAATGRMPVTIL